jgi:hypothetical protein
LLEATSV